jgi:hypothetical protein
MYVHWTVKVREEDERTAREAACLLVRLRAKAAQRVPEWSPEMRETLRALHQKWHWAYRF